MEKDIDPEVIKATQSSLGKYVKRPPLSDKLLKKPPFRFIHDIITSVLKSTGFFEGLFDDSELISENVKDRESKISFLNKVLTVLVYTTGKTLSAKPSKIVAGQEADKTNEFLQCLAQALDKNLTSNEAVKKYKEELQSKQSGDKNLKKNKDVSKVTKGSEDKKLSSRSNEKLTSSRKEITDKTSTNKDKNSTSKPKTTTQEHKSRKDKKDPLRKIAKESKDDKKSSQEIVKHKDLGEKIKVNTVKNTASIDVEKNAQQTNENSPVLKTVDSNGEEEALLDENKQDEEVHAGLNSSYTIEESDLNLSHSSQDLLKLETNENIEISIDTRETYAAETNNGNNEIGKQTETLHEIDLKKSYVKNVKNVDIESDIQSNNLKNSEIIQDASREHTENIFSPKVNQESSKSNFVRPPSARPSSSRPGAPRIRDKHDSILGATDNLLVGKVNIIVENTINDEEEETSIIVVEPTISETQQEELQLQSSNHHGHLVQQILDSQKEFAQNTGKTEIEWQLGSHKMREALNQEIEQVRYNIQALSRAANPLGKLVDHVQEDVEVMRQELQQWTSSYEEAAKELVKQKTANEESLLPLHTKIKQLNADIVEKRDKINDLKVVIHKNSARINKLLSSGNVQ